MRRESELVRQAGELLRQVRENHRILDDCVGPHDFQAVDDGTSLPRKYRCRLCGGTAGRSDVRWYNRGLHHATTTHSGFEK